MRYFNVLQHTVAIDILLGKSGKMLVDISELEKKAKEITEQQAKQKPDFGSGNISVDKSGVWKWEATYFDTSD
jgi:hypothetical protein